MAWEREMSTTPKLHSEYYSIFTFYLPCLQTAGVEGMAVKEEMGKYIL